MRDKDSNIMRSCHNPFNLHYVIATVCPAIFLILFLPFPADAAGSKMVLNKYLIWGASGVLAILILLLAGISVNILRRKKAEEELRIAHDKLEQKVEERTKALSKTNQDLLFDITERKKAEEALQRREKQLEFEQQRLFSLLENMPAFVYLQAGDHTIPFANSYFVEHFGDPKGKFCYETLWRRNAPCDICPTFRVFNTGKPQVWEWDKAPDGRIYQIYDYPFTDIDGSMLVLEMGIDITERKSVEEQIKRSLEEKGVLLKEIHHRVKNNMAVISSLLKLQSQYVKNEQYSGMLTESINRINTMALIHEKLYRSDDLARIDFNNYLDDMIGNIFTSYGLKSRGIALKTDIKDIIFGVDVAIPCGLIVNELISNALKHAFPGDRKGEINVALQVNGQDDVELSVRDDGIGMPGDFDSTHTSTLGLTLVYALVKQLMGKIELHRERGTGYRITFRRRE